MKAPDKIYVEQKAIMYDLVNTEPCKPDDLEYIRKDVLLEWINEQLEKLWELLPDASNDNPTQMELRYLGQYMQLEALEDKVNEM